MRRELVGAKISIMEAVLICFVAIALICIFFPVYTDGHGTAERPQDLSNLKQIGIANAMYMADHDGYGPPPDQWMDSLHIYIKNDRILSSPGLDWEADEHGYAYLIELGGKHLSDIQNQEEIPLIFNSSDLKRNVTGTLKLLPDPPRWEKGNNIVFLDGHAKLHEKKPVFKIELP